MLPPHSLVKAKNFVRQHARSLDLCLFEIEFEKRPASDLIEELEAFQNDDGGFGHGLEPDVQLDASSVIGTTVALQYIDPYQLDSHKLVIRAMNFLKSQIKWQDDQPYWLALPPEIRSVEHPPWWEITDEAPRDEDWSNPNVEIIGYFNRYYKDFELINRLNSQIEEYLSRYRSISGNLYYDFLCWKRAIRYFNETLQKKVLEFWTASFSEEKLSEEQVGHIKPQWLVTETSSFLMQQYTEQMTQLFKQEIGRQDSEGGWFPGWSWQHKKWDQIRYDWAGKITVDLLISLKHCNLIDESI